MTNAAQQITDAIERCSAAHPTNDASTVPVIALRILDKSRGKSLVVYAPGECDQWDGAARVFTAHTQNMVSVLFCLVTQGGDGVSDADVGRRAEDFIHRWCSQFEWL